MALSNLQCLLYVEISYHLHLLWIYQWLPTCGPPTPGRRCPESLQRMVRSVNTLNVVN